MANNEEQTYRQDPLFLHNSDHPGMILTTTKLIGTNFIPWSRSIKISLISKMKIGFINGKCRKPNNPDEPNYAQWERCDNMVFSWILNSMQPDLAEAFLYAKSSEELWNELEERFGESNGPLIYQIEKKIADIKQNNDSVGKGNGQRQNGYNRTDPRKGKKMCEYCKETSHFKEQCFKLVGYPEWYKGPKGKKGQNSYGGGKFAAHTTSQIQDSHFDTPLEDTVSQKGEGYNPMFIQHVAQEMMRMMSHKASTSSKGASLNAYAHLARKSCSIASAVLDSYVAEICCVGTGNTVDWIIDTGASDHMTPFENILCDVHNLPNPITVTLPDGTHKTVTKAGKVKLSLDLVLMDVLYMPDFQFSLISVSKVIDTQRVSVVFLPDKCVFQDPSTEQIMATALRSHGLYKLRVEHKGKEIYKRHGMAANTCTPELLHARLGHTSMSKMKHISESSIDVQHKFHCDVFPETGEVTYDSLGTTPINQPTSERVQPTQSADEQSNSVPESGNNNEDVSQQIRRSSRRPVPPVWMKDYVQPKGRKLSSPVSSQSYSLFAASHGLMSADLDCHSTAFLASLKKRLQYKNQCVLMSL
ncbi:unnamed protein product [Cuscuta campestris]|uniref:Uncharacterized protein n=1 Tax=Cuscuta campestris TaxID=132261 RepID=A0A484MI05_9ASTE|nr:unnamed protein product [Cuscuta campestris]